MIGECFAGKSRKVPFKSTIAESVPLLNPSVMLVSDVISDG